MRIPADSAPYNRIAEDVLESFAQISPAQLNDPNNRLQGKVLRIYEGIARTPETAALRERGGQISS